MVHREEVHFPYSLNCPGTHELDPPLSSCASRAGEYCAMDLKKGTSEVKKRHICHGPQGTKGPGLLIGRFLQCWIQNLLFVRAGDPEMNKALAIFLGGGITLRYMGLV